MWEVWSRYDAKGEFSRPFNPVCLFYNKTCTWKRGRDCYWYVRKEPQHEWVDIWNYGKTYVFNISVLFIVDTTSVLKLFFPFSYWFCHDGQLKAVLLSLLMLLLLFFSLIVTFILAFVVVTIIAAIAFVLHVFHYFCYLCITHVVHF